MKILVSLLLCLLTAQTALSVDNAIFENALDNSLTLEFNVHELQSPVIQLGELEAEDTVQWYTGMSGSTGSPIAGATASDYTVPNGTIPTTVWARVTTTGSTTDSATFDIDFLEAFPAMPAEGAILKTAGRNILGQLGIGDFDYAPSPIKIAEGVVKAATGYLTSFFWKSDGSVWALGSNQAGEAGVSFGGQTLNEPTMIEGNIVDIVRVSSSLNCFLDSDGTLFAAGSDFNGVFAFSDYGNSRRSLHPIMQDVAQVSAAGFSAAVVYLKTDGTAWGSGFYKPVYGTYGSGEDIYFIADKIVSLKAVEYYTLLVNEDDQLLGVGNGPGFKSIVAGTPEPVVLAEGVASIESARADYYVFKDLNGDTFIVTLDNLDPVPLADGIAEYYGDFYITDSGELFGKGGNSQGAVGVGSIFEITEFTKVKDNVSSVVNSDFSTLIVTNDGALFAAGDKWTFGIISEARSGLHTIDDQVMKAVSGNNQVFYVKADNTLWGIGNNRDLEMGDTGISYYDSPGKIHEDVVDVNGGENVFILNTSGELLGVGSNKYGSLGVGDEVRRTQFTAVQNASAVREFQSSSYASMFLNGDGTLWGMGEGFVFITEDDAAPDNALVPFQIAENVVTAGIGQSTCFVDESGDLYAIGDFYGLLINNYIPHTDGSPYKIASGVSSVAVKFSSIAFLKWDGSLWTVGGLSGQLPEPVYGADQVTMPRLIDTNVSSMDIAYRLISYRKADGTSWMLGNPSSGYANHLSEATYEEPKEVYQGMDFLDWDINYSNSVFLVSAEVTPTVVTQPEDFDIQVGGPVGRMSIETSGDTATIQWYRGEKGDKSDPVEGGHEFSLILLEPKDTKIWAEITTASGVVQSEAALVSIASPAYTEWASSYDMVSLVYWPSSYQHRDAAYSYFVEFVFNINPAIGNELQIQSVVDNTNGEIVFKHSRNPSTEEYLSYLISADMQAWTDLPAEAVLEYDSETKIASIRIPSSLVPVPVFFKAVVSQTEDPLP